MKAKIIKHEIPDKTGMIHLCDSAYCDHEEKGSQKRLRLFPLNTVCDIEKAHLFDGIQVYKARINGHLDYFSENELEILEQ